MLDLQTGTFDLRLKGYGGRVNAALFVDEGNTVRVWEMNELHRGGMWPSWYAHAERPFAASGGHDKDVLLWDLDTGNALRRWRGHKDMVMSLNFTPDGKSVISTRGTDSLRVWRVDASKVVLMEWIERKRPFTCEFLI